VVPVLHFPADVLEVALPKEHDEQIANRVVGRGTVPTVLRACALVVVAVLVVAWDARVVLATSTVNLAYSENSYVTSIKPVPVMFMAYSKV
jgi:hypothetical protein